ncbi:MAG: transglutaminase domain-containing protein [Pseudomonadales bacterium]
MVPRRQLTLFLLLSVLTSAVGAEQPSRVFSFAYKTRIATVAAGEGPVHVFIPLAVDNDQQHIINEQIETSITGQVEVEDNYGNRFWHGSVKVSDGLPIEITINTTVERRVSRLQSPEISRPINHHEQATMARFLGANAKVVVDHAILKPILQEVEKIADSNDLAKISRAIYDWVVANVDYKKVGTGWGNGDTFWACSERYGNCTDFHALFISLARSENIPARFEIGFSVPNNRDSGYIAGYHCWVQLYLPTIGWFPIDASEAFKHPEKKEYFFGAHPPDRIHFSTGRDLRLGEGHRAKALNYFVYPYVEVGGKPFAGKVSRHFSYRNLQSVGRHLAADL